MLSFLSPPLSLSFDDSSPHTSPHAERYAVIKYLCQISMALLHVRHFFTTFPFLQHSHPQLPQFFLPCVPHSTASFFHSSLRSIQCLIQSPITPTIHPMSRIFILVNLQLLLVLSTSSSLSHSPRFQLVIVQAHLVSNHRVTPAIISLCPSSCFQLLPCPR